MHSNEQVEVRPHHAYLENVRSFLTGDAPQEPAEKPRQSGINEKLSLACCPGDVMI